ncbi:MAG: hypothetical protein ACYS8W_18810 [Planctomycetota bacterium]|jgi:hypothetical protein
MRIGLSLKLGIIVVAVFGIVIAGLFLYRPLKYARLKAQLLSEEEAVREAAFDRLVKEEGRAIPYIRALLQSEQKELVKGACSALEGMKGKHWLRALPELEYILDGKSSEMTAAAASVIIARENDLGAQWDEEYSGSSKRLENIYSHALGDLPGRDLREMEKGAKAEMEKLINRLTKKKKDRLRWSGSPWYIWRIPEEGEKFRYLLFIGHPLMSIPGASGAEIYIFASSGKKISYTSFSTGWRIGISVASLSIVKSGGGPIITVDSRPAINGRPVMKQYYGVIGDEIWTIRIEGSNGELLNNRYVYPNHTIGPRNSGRKEEGWKAALDSKNRLEVLSALIWLGGRHLDAETVRENVRKEDKKEAAVYHKVADDPEVGRKVKKLCSSEDEWIKEAAEMALKRVNW